MAGRIKTVVGLLSELLDNPKMEQTGRLRDYSNATSKDPDKILEDWMRPNQVVVDPIEYPVVNLSDFEGRGYVLGESDRAIANRRLEGIGNKALSSPIDLNTGSNFMFHNDQVWSSGKSVVSRMMNQAKVLKEQTGKNPIMLPRLLGPQGVDFDKNLMTTMLRWNVVNAPKSTLKQQDVILKDAIPGWRGATDSQSMEAFYNLPADTRKAVQLKLDKLKNEGGLSIGNARVALTNPDLIDVPNNTLPAIAEIDVDKGMAPNSSLNYPFGMYGEGKGILSEPLTARQLTAPDDIFFKNDGTRLPDRYVDYWIKQANPSGILDRAKLNALSDAGVKFKSAAIPGVATAGVAGASLLGSEDADASVAKLAARGMELVDLIDPEDSRVGEYFLRQGDDTKSIGSLKTDYAIDSGFDQGYMSSLNTEIAPGYRRQGLAGEMYDAAEEISGNKLVPSTHLSMDGAHMWNARDSKLLREVHEKMGPENYNEVEDILYPEGRPSPNAIKLRGFKDRVHGPAPVATAGLLGAGVLGSEDADAAPLTAFTDKGNKWLQKLLAEAEQADLPQSAIDQGYSPSILQHVGEPGLQGYDLNAAAAANENAVSGMYNYPTKRESDRYLDQMQRYRDKSLEQYETVTRGDKAFVIGGDTPTPEMEQQFLSELEDAFKVKYSELPEHKQGWFDEKVDQFLRYGDLTASPLSRDAKNRIYRAGGADVLVRNGREIVSLKPEQVRSPKAQFNIDDQGSNNFMASVAGAGVLGALALPQNSQAEEYTEAPVIDEQSFGSMVQEYGDINRRAKAADDQKFGLLMADRSDRAGMSRRDRRGSPASPELQEFTRANALPSLLQFASGVGEGGVDYLKDTFSGGGYVTAPAYASQQYEDINRAAMMAPEEAKAPLRPEQIYLDPRMAEEAERLRNAGVGFAGILSMLSPI